MGATPWSCSTEYAEPLQETLVKLRHKTFLAEVASDPSQYKTGDAIDEGIAEYVEECDADGTCSILDIEAITTEPENFDCGTACPLTSESLIEFFGSDKPDKSLLARVERIDGLYEMIDRGQALYIPFYDQGKPAVLYFLGYSYD